MTVFPDKAIRECIWPSNGARATVFVPHVRLEKYGPIQDSQVQPISLDVRLSGDFLTFPHQNSFSVGEYLDLAPGECILGSTVERFDMGADNVGAQVHGKSTIARQFITVHAAGLIDPGFIGDITLEIKNDGPVAARLHINQPIAQVQFYFLAAPVDRLYGQKELESHYQFQSGPTSAA